MTILYFSIHVHIWEYDFFMYLAAHIILDYFSYHLYCDKKDSSRYTHSLYTEEVTQWPE